MEGFSQGGPKRGVRICAALGAFARNSWRVGRERFEIFAVGGDCEGLGADGAPGGGGLFGIGGSDRVEINAHLILHRRGPAVLSGPP